MRRRMKQVQVTLVVCTSLVVIFFTSPSSWLEKPWQRSIPSEGFNPDYLDVLVILHIPRTGMTSVVNWIMTQSTVTPKCTCQVKKTKCRCLNTHRQPWIFNSFNTTGFVCGEYADYTTLTNCPIDHWFQTSGQDSRPIRRYYLITMLREPTARYISEWLYVKNEEENLFRNEPRIFRNVSIELQKKGVSCFVGTKASTLSLLDFINCRDNPANNRVTKMLANLTEVNALRHNGQEYEAALLRSAQLTLTRLPFFGIMDRPGDTFKLLEHELGLGFHKIFRRVQSASEQYIPLDAAVLNLLKQVNHLDFKLFQFAQTYFDQKMSLLRESVKQVKSIQTSDVSISDRKLTSSYLGQYRSIKLSATDHQKDQKKMIQTVRIREQDETENEKTVLHFIDNLEKLKSEHTSVSPNENGHDNDGSNKLSNGHQSQFRSKSTYEKSVSRMFQ